MIASFWGTLRVEITSAEPEKTLDRIAASGISISQIVKKSELIYQFSILSKDYTGLSEIVRKHHGHSRILSKLGLYWYLKAISCRPALIFCILLILLLSAFLPARIFFIEVDGNQSLSEYEILSAAEECGIAFGVSRKQIRSEKTKNQLLAVLPQLQWAGINTSGCRAVISVRERAGSEMLREDKALTNVVADRDAYVLSATVTAGTQLVHPGDSVIKGQALISGYEDQGFCIRAGKASGEILGLTIRNITAQMPGKYLLVDGTTGRLSKISLLIRKKRINLWKDSRISEACCGRMYEEYYVSLPGGYCLPVAVCLDRYFHYQTEEDTVADSALYEELQKASDVYLLQQMVAGRILQRKHGTVDSADACVLKSSYTCAEIIGREQSEQIGEHNGKRN